MCAAGGKRPACCAEQRSAEREITNPPWDSIGSGRSDVTVFTAAKSWPKKSPLCRENLGSHGYLLAECGDARDDDAASPRRPPTRN